MLQGSAAPVASWTASRVSSDLALSKDLMLKLDAEKGIAENALLPQAKQELMDTGTALLVFIQGGSANTTSSQTTDAVFRCKRSIVHKQNAMVHNALPLPVRCAHCGLVA